MSELVQIKKQIKELQDAVQTLQKGKRKKTSKPREPSAYNIFMKRELTKIKSQKPNLPHTEAFKEAANRWQKTKK